VADATCLRRRPTQQSTCAECDGSMPECRPRTGRRRYCTTDRKVGYICFKIVLENVTDLFKTVEYMQSDTQQRRTGQERRRKHQNNWRCYGSSGGKDPYPAPGETILATHGMGLSKAQVNNWFDNERKKMEKRGERVYTRHRRIDP